MPDSIALKNTAAATAGKTALLAESDTVITGNLTFNRAANPPFSVQVGSAMVPNLDAEFVGGFTAAQLASITEGTWTPVIGGAGGTSGQVYSAQQGRYIKLGHLVWVAAYVVLSTKGTITGNVQIAGLPFAAESGVLNAFIGLLKWFNTSGNWIDMHAVVAGGGSVASVVGLAAAGVSAAGANLVTGDIANITGFELNLMYRTAS